MGLVAASADDPSTRTGDDGGVGVKPGLAQQLSARTLEQLVAGLGATEVLGDDGGPLLDAAGEGTRGVMRLHVAPGVARIVSTVLTVPAREVATCMIFAFTEPDSALPHFTLDCSDRPDGNAFHLDLLPRVELATAVPYMDEVFEPLTPLYTAAQDIEGLSATGNTRRQYAMMSPWMLVHLATPDAFDAVSPTVTAYADHWLSVVRRGLGPEAQGSVEATGTDLAARDAMVRRNLFSPEIDPVWGRVEGMLGAEAARAIRTTLAD
jgi:hypothetical protein